MTEQDLITLQEAAKILKVSARTLRRLIDSGELQAFKRIGRKSLLVSQSKIEELREPRPVVLKRRAKRK
jgi:excisionase family DNA binding protein